MSHISRMKGNISGGLCNDWRSMKNNGLSNDAIERRLNELGVNSDAALKETVRVYQENIELREEMERLVKKIEELKKEKRELRKRLDTYIDDADHLKSLEDLRESFDQIQQDNVRDDLYHDDHYGD